jgi:hypothetical protein
MPEFVSVQVPVERVQEVYELLGRQPSRASVVHYVTEEGHPAGWNQALIDRMFVESSDAMQRILVAIAQRSPGFVTSAEIGAAAGMTVRQVVASLGPFGKRIRGRYGMALWPFETRDFVDAGVIKYSMPTETARRIITLMAESLEHEQAIS